MSGEIDYRAPIIDSLIKKVLLEHEDGALSESKLAREVNEAAMQITFGRIGKRDLKKSLKRLFKEEEVDKVHKDGPPPPEGKTEEGYVHPSRVNELEERGVLVKPPFDLVEAQHLLYELSYNGKI